jgi:predicted PurR-regulated permease PerM
MVFCLGMVLKTGLLGALLAGLAVYTCTHGLAARLPRPLGAPTARQVALGLLAVSIVALLTFGMMGLVGFFRSGGLTDLFLRMGEILTQLRPHLPGWLTENWPSSFDATGAWAGDQLRDHANGAQSMGQDALHGLGRLVIGMLLGGLVAIAHERPKQRKAPLAGALTERVSHLTAVFQQVVFAQIKIATVNTLLTAVFLLVILPCLGTWLPFTKTLITLTFLMGFLPVFGNLVSNSAVVVMALSVSPGMAMLALAYLVIIHKLEYFLNAHIVGGHIQARAWELLAAMLIMEAAFGIPGVVAAPIYYAYLKRELRLVGWL